MVLSSPVSSTVVAVGVASVTAWPSVGVAGALSPFARRTVTASRSASVGLVQDRWMNVSPRAVTARSVTGPGGEVSATGFALTGSAC